MRVFVTGVTGKSGLYFLKEITNAPEEYSFTFLVRDSRRAQQLKEFYPRHQFICGTLDDTVFISTLFSRMNFDVVLHIAGIHRTLSLLDSAINNGVKWLICVHTTGIYSKYKAAGEGYRAIEKQIRHKIKGRDVALTILRPTMIYGTLNDNNVSVFMKMVYKCRIFPVVNHGRYELQPVWCGDLGKAYYQVLMNPIKTKNKEYNLSGGAPIMLIDMFKTMGRLLNVKNIFLNVPFWIAYSGAWGLYVLTGKKKDYREKVQRLVEPRVFSHEEAYRDFGYNPICFEDGVKQEVELFLKREGKL